MRAREADGADEVCKAVREQIKAGADYIKFMASGGVAEPTENPEAVQLNPSELQAGAEEAIKLGRKVIVHAHSTKAINNALDAGAYSIEHEHI